MGTRTATEDMSRNEPLLLIAAERKITYFNTDTLRTFIKKDAIIKMLTAYPGGLSVTLDGPSLELVLPQHMFSAIAGDLLSRGACFKCAVQCGDCGAHTNNSFKIFHHVFTYVAYKSKSKNALIIAVILILSQKHKERFLAP